MRKLGQVRPDGWIALLQGMQFITTAPAPLETSPTRCVREIRRTCEAAVELEWRWIGTDRSPPLVVLPSTSTRSPVRSRGGGIGPPRDR